MLTCVYKFKMGFFFHLAESRNDFYLVFIHSLALYFFCAPLNGFQENVSLHETFILIKEVDNN